MKTVDVFAARHGMEANEFRSIVCSETSLEDKIFTRMPRAKLTDFRQRVIELNLALLRNYFDSTYKSAEFIDPFSMKYTS